MKKILFVTYGGVHVNIVKYLAPVLAEEFEIEILALTMAPQVFDRMGVKYKRTLDYLSLFTEEKEKICEYGKRLAEKEYNPESGIQYEECVSYLGFGFWDLVHTLDSEKEAYARFEEKGRKAFCPINVMKRILEFERPNMVIVTCDVRMEKAAGIAANIMEIPVLNVHYLPELAPLPYEADVCVMNEYARKYISDHNIVPEKRVHVTGFISPTVLIPRRIS